MHHCKDLFYVYVLVGFCLCSTTMTHQLAPFFISPAYSVPRMTISWRLKLTDTDVVDVIPVVYRLAVKLC